MMFSSHRNMVMKKKDKTIIIVVIAVLLFGATVINLIVYKVITHSAGPTKIILYSIAKDFVNT